VPVNIIQHPGGRSKRYGIRNNLVSASTATELRYFTDTESGSSGSPVFNDQWQVVALHRASIYVAQVEFQGKTTAYVNVGTHLSAILDDLRAHHPSIAAEVGV
jgi:V8-like Glu-specific endopeptidase